MKIGIVIGSIREGRKGEAVGAWVAERAAKRGGADYEVIDLKAYDVPLLTSATVPGAAKRQYDDERVTRWGQAIDSCDGFIFVTPEYNHSVPGGFKNAFDSIGPEWADKTVAFVSYGADNGVRAVEHWRQITANFRMHDVRAQLSLGTFTDFDGSDLAVLDRRAGEFDTLLDHLLPMTEKLSS